MEPNTSWLLEKTVAMEVVNHSMENFNEIHSLQWDVLI